MVVEEDRVMMVVLRVDKGEEDLQFDWQMVLKFSQPEEAVVEVMDLIVMVEKEVDLLEEMQKVQGQQGRVVPKLLVDQEGLVQ